MTMSSDLEDLEVVGVGLNREDVGWQTVPLGYGTVRKGIPHAVSGFNRQV